MRILFDQGTPVPLRRQLAGHTIMTAYEQGWASLTNGALLEAAGRRLALIVLRSTSWPRIRIQVATIQAVLDTIVPGSHHEIAI